jgi:hypothetical protein
VATKQEKPLDIYHLLLEYHLAYQGDQKRLVTSKEFAEYIGINDKYFSLIYNKKRPPSKAITKLLADFFNDLRFYDVAGEPRPDPLLNYVQLNWGKVPESVKKKIRDAMAPYVPDENNDH